MHLYLVDFYSSIDVSTGIVMGNMPVSSPKNYAYSQQNKNKFLYGFTILELKQT